MSVSLHVGGTTASELRYLAAKFEKAAKVDLSRALAKARRDAVKPLQKEIKAEAAATLPKRGSYNLVMSRAVKVSVLGANNAGRPMTIKIYARGKAEERDVKAVNAGRLRHPVFGVWRRRVPPTLVRPGFVDRPLKKLADQILDNSGQEIEAMLKEIARR